MFVSLARVCHLYYNEGLTQQQVASRLRISRVKVSRMLQQAHATGVVKIDIKYSGFYPELEKQLGERYDTEFVVAESNGGSSEDLLKALGQTGADYLCSVMEPRDWVTVGWGTTMASVAAHLDCSLPHASFIPLVGGQSNVGFNIHANAIASLMAERTGGSSEAIFAPAVADSIESRDLIVKSRAVSRVLEAAARSPICLFSVGAPFSGHSTLTQVGFYTSEDLQQLRMARAALDLISISYYAEAGKRCGHDISARTISITEEQLRAIPKKICVAGGTEKHEAIKIALQLGIIDTMITDNHTAQYLLQ